MELFLLGLLAFGATVALTAVGAALLLAAWRRLRRPSPPDAGGLADRVARLESRVDDLSRRLAAAPAPERPPAPGTASPPPAAAVPGPGDGGEPAPAPAPPAPSRPPATAPPPLRSRPSLEERLGARLPVWIGSIALALAGAFLVKYSIDQGWIGPRVRVLAALAFGALLVAAGERLRRTAASIAQGLSAAGIAVLYAALFAAVQLYALLGAGTGFAAMAVVTAGAVALSLRHGPMVALIGLLGGLLTPQLVAAATPRPGQLFAYLLLLEVGLLAVTRRRRWTALAFATLAGGYAWTGLWLAGAVGRGGGTWAALFLLAGATAAVVSSAEPGTPRRWRGAAAAVAAVGVAGALTLLAGMVVTAGFSTTDWLFVGALAAGVLVLARLDATFLPLAGLAAVAVGLLAVAWAWRLDAAEVGRFLATTAAFGALFAGGSYAALWGAPRPAHWARLAAAAAVAAPLVALAGAARAGRPLPAGALLLTLAAVAAAAVGPLLSRRAALGAAAAAAPALAAAALAALAAFYELERTPLTVAWALEVLLLVEAGRRLRLEALWRGAVPLALLVAARLLLAPGLHVPPDGWIVLNGLSAAYGLPLAAFALGAARLRGAGEAAGPPGEWRGGLARALELAAVAFAVAGVTWEVRQAFHGAAWDAPLDDLGEWGTLLVAWLGLAALLDRAAARAPGRGLGAAGRLLALAALAAALVGPVLLADPAWRHLPVGRLPIVNLVLWVYGVPAALLAAHAVRRGRRGDRGEAAAAGVGALVLLFALVTLEVRQAFRGAWLDGPGAGHAESYAYSAAWVVLGIALLVTGVARHRGRLLRLASLAVMALAAGKVFLYDTAHLSDLYRVLSFLGLGASLLLLAWLYQRFVFAAPPPADSVG